MTDLHNIAKPIAHLAVPIGDLIPYPRNPRRGNLTAIVESLAKNAQYRPIVVNQRNQQILAGNHTWQAAKKLGWTHLAVTYVDCDDQQAARIVAVDNRANDIATYDFAELQALLETLPDLTGTGYTEDELNQLLNGQTTVLPPAAPLTDADAVPDVPDEPITKPGDIWQIGPHRIICGDSRDYDTVAKLLDGKRINVAFTSPPYASQRKYDESSGFRPIPPDEYVDWFEDVQANVRALLADDGSWFVNIKEHCDDGQRHLYVKDLTIAHVRRWGWAFVDELCWVDTLNGFPGGYVGRFKDAWEPVFHFATSKGIKFNPLANGHVSDKSFQYDPDTQMTMGGTGYVEKQRKANIEGLARPSNVIQIAAGGGNGHSAAFPVALPAWFIRAYSDPGDTIFDPFMGSGTTLIAAHQEGRVAYGTEISPAYCDVIVRRFKDHTGIEPVLADRGEST